MEFIDDMTDVAKTKPEDDDEEDEQNSPKASVDQPIVEQTYPTRKLTMKTNEINHCETLGTSKIYPVYFKQGPDQPRLNTFAGVFRATNVNGKHFEVTNC